jgi:hypothetical protein
MTAGEIMAKQAELDRLLNDPETRMDAQRVWVLTAELAAAATYLAASNASRPAPRPAMATGRLR